MDTASASARPSTTTNSPSRFRRLLRHHLVPKHSWLLGALYVAGVVGWLLLVDDRFNKATYVSENALLVGSSSAEVGHAEMLVAEQLTKQFNSHISNDADVGDDRVWRAEIARSLRAMHLPVGEQPFTLPAHGGATRSMVAGTNLYAKLAGRRSDGTESVVLAVPLRNRRGQRNTFGVGVALSLVDALHRRNYWAKDFLLVFPEHGHRGMHVFMDAYHGGGSGGPGAQRLAFRAGAIQAGVSLEFGNHTQYTAFSVLTEGLNGQMPNLDLINTVVRVAANRGVSVYLQDRVLKVPPVPAAYQRYFSSLQNLALMMKHQAVGEPTGVHGVLIRYRIEAVTMYGHQHPSPQAYHREVDARDVLAITEETLRSVNNLQERFHQSFFFYLLPTPSRYISIGMYFPPLLLIGLNLMWKGMLVWYLTSDWKVEDDLAAKGAESPVPTASSTEDDPIDQLPREPAYSVRPRYLFEPTLAIGFCFACGVGVFMAPSRGYAQWVPVVFGGGIVAAWLMFQVLAGLAVRRRRRPATKLDQAAPASYILYCFTLILTCVLFISVAILNFSLSFALLMVTVPVYLQLLPLASDYGYARAAWRTFVVLPAVLLLSPFGVAVWSSYVGQYGFDEWMYALANLPTTLTTLDVDAWLSAVRSLNAWELAASVHQHLPELTTIIQTLNNDYLLMGRWLWPFVALVWTPVSMLAAVLCLV